MVILPAPTPILAIPAPEMFSRLENVPADEEVVLPRAVRLMLEVWTTAEMVMVEALFPMPIPAPAEIETLEDVPFNWKLVAAGTVGPTMVMELAPEFRVILAPADRLRLILEPLSLKFGLGL